MNKRPDVGGIINVAVILAGIAAIGSLIIAISYWVADGADEYWWPIFVGSLIAYFVLSAIRGIHNVLLDIRDGIFYQLGYTSDADEEPEDIEEEDVIPAQYQSNLSSAERELDEWKASYIQKVNAALLAGEISKEKAEILSSKCDLAQKSPRVRNDSFFFGLTNHSMTDI